MIHVSLTAVTAFYWRPIYTPANKEYSIAKQIILDI